MGEKLRVLIGGEYSGTIRDAFIARGHDAMSCDFSASIAPGPHYRGDWADIEERRMARSKFTPGHADAIADQWGAFVMAQRQMKEAA